MHTQLFTMIALFTLYLLPQAMFINGIWLAASGKTEIRPDGTDHDSEMILYPLAKYFNRKKMQIVYYDGQQLADLCAVIFHSYPTLDTIENLTDDQIYLWKKQQRLIEHTLDIKIYVRSTSVNFYREYSVYRFSKFIRKPLFGCVICMPSFWGIFTFLIPGLLFTHFDPLMIALYVPNTVCLSYLTFKIMKPV